MLGLERVSAQDLSDTIGAIYDCALDPNRWRDAFRRVAQLCDSSASALCVHDLKNHTDEQFFESGYSPGFYEKYQAYLALSPFTSLCMVAEVGAVHTFGTMCSDQELFESRFYRELLKPFGYLDYIGFIALRTAGRVASVHAARKEGAPRYSSRDVALLTLLSPHVCRALTISDALDLKTLRSEALEATLDGLATAVYLIARDGRVVYMNAAAARQINSGHTLRSVNNRLVPTDANARTALACALAEADRDDGKIRSQGYTVAISDGAGAGYVATILPLGCGERKSVVAPFAARLAVFVQDPAEVPLMPGEAFARLYRLTGAEVRVLLALSQGLGGKEAADMLGVGEPTVRTHLQRIFSKTGTSRQTDLLGLLRGSTPPTKIA
jgi:DNA-binding CsgD family transcriptional regulator